MILNRQRSVRLSVGPLETFLRLVRRELGIGEAQVTVCLVSDAEIAGMNKQFRKKPGPTDVLSFPAVKRHRMRSKRIPVAAASDELLGDIAIAPAVAKRNSKTYGRTFPAELKILILHGVLHLLGYDHETDHGEMDCIERRLRRRLRLA
jgi:probable rRNA maturation factor